MMRRLAFVTGTGEEGTLKIRQRLEDKEALIVTLELSEPVTFSPSHPAYG